MRDPVCTVCEAQVDRTLDYCHGCGTFVCLVCSLRVRVQRPHTIADHRPTTLRLIPGGLVKSA